MTLSMEKSLAADLSVQPYLRWQKILIFLSISFSPSPPPDPISRYQFHQRLYLKINILLTHINFYFTNI
jgi:hypothetical protein